MNAQERVPYTQQTSGVSAFASATRSLYTLRHEAGPFAHQLASIVVWIGYLQWKLKNGYEPAGETPTL